MTMVSPVQYNDRWMKSRGYQKSIMVAMICHHGWQPSLSAGYQID